jgi:hypothetical protein
MSLSNSVVPWSSRGLSGVELQHFLALSCW